MYGMGAVGDVVGSGDIVGGAVGVKVGRKAGVGGYVGALEGGKGLGSTTADAPTVGSVGSGTSAPVGSAAGLAVGDGVG